MAALFILEQGLIVLLSEVENEEFVHLLLLSAFYLVIYTALLAPTIRDAAVFVIFATTV